MSSTVRINVPRQVAERFSAVCAAALVHYQSIRLPSVEQQVVTEDCARMVTAFRNGLDTPGTDPVEIEYDREQAQFEAEEMRETLDTLGVDSGGVDPQQLADGHVVYEAFAEALRSQP